SPRTFCWSAQGEQMREGLTRGASGWEISQDRGAGVSGSQTGSAVAEEPEKSLVRPISQPFGLIQRASGIFLTEALDFDRSGSPRCRQISARLKLSPGLETLVFLSSMLKRLVHSSVSRYLLALVGVA